MRIDRNLSLGDEEAPGVEITVQTDTDDDGCVSLIVADHHGADEEGEPVTAYAFLTRDEAIALAKLLNDAANDG